MSTENYLRELRWKEINALRAENTKLREALEDIASFQGRDQRAQAEIARAALQKDCKHAWHPDQETGEYFCLECGQKEEEVKNRTALQKESEGKSK